MNGMRNIMKLYKSPKKSCFFQNFMILYSSMTLHTFPDAGGCCQTGSRRREKGMEE